MLPAQQPITRYFGVKLECESEPSLRDTNWGLELNKPADSGRYKAATSPEYQPKPNSAQLAISYYGELRLGRKLEPTKPKLGCEIK